MPAGTFLQYLAGVIAWSQRMLVRADLLGIQLTCLVLIYAIINEQERQINLQ